MQQWLTRIGEGIFIGFGASLAFFVFTTFTASITKLENATQAANNQIEISQKLKDLSETNSKEMQVLRTFVEKNFIKSNENLDALVAKVQAISNEVSKNDTSKLNYDPKVWENLKSNSSTFQGIPSVTPETPWAINGSTAIQEFHNIDKLLEKQRDIGL